jgi:membrane associated rhomboid family serine protease
MFFPIGDSPSPRGVPFTTYALIALNVAVYVLVTLPLGATSVDLHDPAVVEYLRTLGPVLADRLSLETLIGNLTQYDVFVFSHGFRPDEPTFASLFSSLFLHANLAHLAGNMLFLWIYGDNVEIRIGHGRYLLLYLGAGVAASLFHALVALGSPVPTIGASGAISGVLGAYFVWFPRNRIRVLLLFPFMTVVLLPARMVLGLYIVADNLLPFLLTSQATGVAYGAHIGGFFAGLGYAWGSRSRPPDTRRRGRIVSLRGDHAAARAISEGIAEERFGDAAVEYFSIEPAATRRMLTPDDALALAGWLRRNGNPAAALTILRRHLRDYPNGPLRAEAHVAAGWVLLDDMDEPTAARQHFLEALGLEPSPELAALAREGIQTVDQPLRMRRH